MMANIFMFRITSTIYYSSVAEALTTFVIITVATLITTIMFIHTIYKFFCEKIPIFDGQVIDTDKKRDSGVSGASHVNDEDKLSVRGRNNSSTRSHLPRPNSIGKRSRGSQSSKSPSHSKEISFLIAGLTICYLLNASLYTFINCLIRLLMIFFGVNITCYALGYIQISYVLIKISFYVLFIVRLHLTFEGSNLAVKLLYLKCLCILSILLLIAATCYFLYDVESQFEDAGFDCSKNSDFNLVEPLLPAVIVDTTTSIILLYLFISKLSELIRVQTSTVGSFIGADRYLIDRIKNLILVMTKLTVLVCVYIIGYWLILFTFFPLLPGSAIMIDIIVGTFCVIFCYEFHQQNYDKYCKPCKYLCFHVCFWWFIICKTDKNTNSLQCKHICCPQKKFIAQSNKTNNDKKEIMLSTKETKLANSNNNNNNNSTKQEDNKIEAMIMNEITVPKSDMDEDIVMNKVSSVSVDTSVETSVDNLAMENFEHEKTNTFIINLNADTMLEQDMDDMKGNEKEVIQKSETNTFDYRAQRLREMHQLFFGDTFKSNKRKRTKNVKKQSSKNKKLMPKKFETDFNIYNEDDDDDDDEKDADNTLQHHEKAKKSQTAIF